MKKLTAKQLESVSGAGFFDNPRGGPAAPINQSWGNGGLNGGGFNIAVTPSYPNSGFGVSIANGYGRTPNGIQWGQPTIGASWTWRW